MSANNIVVSLGQIWFNRDYNKTFVIKSLESNKAFLQEEGGKITISIPANNLIEKDVWMFHKAAVNSALLDELLSGGVYADPQGYWKSRGFNDFPGWHKLPFADFFENLSDPKGHKKMWLNPDGTFKDGRTAYECNTLMPLYDGITQTQFTIVATSFFMYSALVVNLHLNLAFYSRKLSCSPDFKSCYEAGSDKVKADLDTRALATRAIAFIGYEGDGLGGFAEKSWQFWGRITGKCPEDVVIKDKSGMLIFDAQVAEEDYKYFSSDKVSEEEKKSLFFEWWSYIHPDYNKAAVDKMYAAFKMVKMYQQFESPMCMIKFEQENQTHVQAVLCGFFRRSAVGLSEARVYDSNDLDNPANRFADMLEMARPTLEKLLTGHEGITPFGEYILDVLEINSRRNALVDRITARQNEAENVKTSLLKEGFKLRVSKRGRARI